VLQSKDVQVKNSGAESKTCVVVPGHFLSKTLAKRIIDYPVEHMILLSSLFLLEVVILPSGNWIGVYMESTSVCVVLMSNHTSLVLVLGTFRNFHMSLVLVFSIQYF
jgi:hypothetical protein